MWVHYFWGIVITVNVLLIGSALNLMLEKLCITYRRIRNDETQDDQ